MPKGRHKKRVPTARKRKAVRLGGRRTPIRPKKREPPEFMEGLPKEGIPKPIPIRKLRTGRKRKRPKPMKARDRVIEVGIKIGAKTQVVSIPQSVRGAFEEGTEVLVDSTIIHLIIYEPETQRLYIQLTAAGKWRDYTYFGVSIRKFEAFRDAPSKGRYFNRNIRNSNKHGFNHIYSRGKQI